MISRRFEINTLKLSLRVHPLHDPAVDVAEHVGVEAVRGGVGSHVDVETGDVKLAVILASG